MRRKIKEHEMTRNAVFTAAGNKVQYIPIQPGEMLVTLSDFNDSSFCEMVVLPITSELPTCILYESRYYALGGSWSEGVPEGEKKRSFYLQKENFEPREGLRVYEAESPDARRHETPVQYMTEGLAAMWQKFVNRL